MMLEKPNESIETSNSLTMSMWEVKFESKIAAIASSGDPAHDLLHFKRVVHLAKKLCREENGNLQIVVPAAWLHDFVIVAKDSPSRGYASRISAEKASLYLREVGYPEIYIAPIAHAIESHSFSANIEAKTLEAQIVQDADRLDGVGAIGIARCFATAGVLKRSLYADCDPFCEQRIPNDAEFTVDHFYKKLFRTVETLKTKSGQQEGLRRAEIMKKYLFDLSVEVTM